LADFDLIPPSYHAEVRLVTELRRFAWVCGSVLVALVLARLGVAELARGVAPRIQSLHGVESRLASQHAEYDQLAQRRTEVERSLRTLHELRGQGSIDALADAIDAAVDDAIWLREIKFSRTRNGEDAVTEDRRAGYLVVVAPTPRPGEQAAAVAALRALEHLEMRGLATGHRALVEFLQRLERQPGVRDVRLVRTSPAGQGSAARVDFDAIVLIDPERGAGK